uniref:Uncharacterized protein n=1 Tax=Arundo donax TaxID=35708 RepID=A0A0A9F099_ARUDO
MKIFLNNLSDFFLQKGSNGDNYCHDVA